MRNASQKKPVRAAAAAVLPDTARPEVAIPYLLKQLHQCLRHAMDEGMRRQRVDISFPHFVILYLLESEPGVVGAELARRSFVTAQTMNALLRRLEEERLIERRPHPSNGRADSWHITRVGQTKLAASKSVAEAVWARLLSALEPREVAQFQNYLSRCIEGMESAPEAPVQSRKPKKKAAKRALPA